VIDGPPARDPFDDSHVHRVLAGQIDVTNDHQQLAGNGAERVSRVPEAFQMVEELTPFFRTGTVSVTRQGDRAGEQFFKHGRPPSLGDPSIVRPVMWPSQSDFDRNSTNGHAAAP
jgi:hypothetical protein